MRYNPEGRKDSTGSETTLLSNLLKVVAQRRYLKACEWMRPDPPSSNETLKLATNGI